MNVLHISSDFFFTEVYDKLFNALNDKGFNQVVYTALKKKRELPESKTKSYQVISAAILSKTDSFLFDRRVNKSMAALIEKTDITRFSLIHAHFLFTDGALALRLYEKYGIPYIVTVRNTDISIYFKYFPHLKGFVKRIMESAKKVVFIAPGHRKFVENTFIKPEFSEIRKKFTTISNGINSYWHDNVNKPKTLKGLKEINFLFVGEISKNKNLEYTIMLLEKLKTSHPINFTVVGKESDGSEKFQKFIRDKPWVSYLGEVSDISKLKEIYRTADIFIMLSKFETFGLVYIESMSQGTPVIYAEGQGIDGYFKNGEVGSSFPSKDGDPVEFKNSIQKIIFNYTDYSSRSIQEASKFNWKTVAEQYNKIYAE